MEDRTGLHIVLMTSRRWRFFAQDERPTGRGFENKRSVMCQRGFDCDQAVQFSADICHAA